jgi:hypothetical protein
MVPGDFVKLGYPRAKVAWECDIGCTSSSENWWPGTSSFGALLILKSHDDVTLVLASRRWSSKECGAYPGPFCAKFRRISIMVLRSKLNGRDMPPSTPHWSHQNCSVQDARSQVLTPSASVRPMTATKMQAFSQRSGDRGKSNVPSVMRITRAYAAVTQLFKAVREFSYIALLNSAPSAAFWGMLGSTSSLPSGSAPHLTIVVHVQGTSFNRQNDDAMFQVRSRSAWAAKARSRTTPLNSRMFSWK